MTTILIADDQPVVRQGFSMFLHGRQGIEVVGQASSGREAVAKARSLRPDVILMDIRMPDGDGLAATRSILSEHDGGPVPRIIVVTTFDVDEYVFLALDHGASGFLLKDTPPDELIRAVRVVGEGGCVLAPSLTGSVVSEFSRRRAASTTRPSADHQLTEREVEVVDLLAKGRSNAEIATELCLQMSTVKSHVSRVGAKLGVRSRVQIVVWAYANGLADPSAADTGPTP